MRIALHLLGLSEDDIAEIRTALGMLSEVYPAIFSLLF